MFFISLYFVFTLHQCLRLSLSSVICSCCFFVNFCFPLPTPDCSFFIGFPSFFFPSLTPCPFRCCLLSLSLIFTSRLFFQLKYFSPPFALSYFLFFSCLSSSSPRYITYLFTFFSNHFLCYLSYLSLFSMLFSPGGNFSLDIMSFYFSHFLSSN